MPLVLFTGYPSSGKTTMAHKLIQLLQKKIDSEPSLSNYSIVYHSDETLGITHQDYVTSQDERKLRSKIISVVRRDLSRNKIVIVDSLNYIKGFRYQLHCEVKNVMTTYCLIHVMCPPETLKAWNNSTSISVTNVDGSSSTRDRQPWDTELLNQLVQRYEEPNPQTRWDSPLFPILAPEDSLDAVSDELYKVLLPQLFKAFKDRDTEKLLSSLRPNNATILKPASQTNFIQILDKETSSVVKKIMAHLQSNVISGTTRVIVSDSKDINDDSCVFVELPAGGVTVAQLQRIRRQFVAMNRLRSMEEGRVVPLFVDYLNKNLIES